MEVNIDFISSTAYEVYKMISSINISNSKDRIQEIKDSLENTKYNPDENIS